MLRIFKMLFRFNLLLSLFLFICNTYIHSNSSFSDFNSLENMETYLTDNFSKYRKNYIVTGDNSAMTELQFSFRYLLIKETNLFFGYTQTSWWRLYENSSPFEITHYNPEFFYVIELNKYSFSNIILGLHEHKSNGMDGSKSRTSEMQYIKFENRVSNFLRISNKFFYLWGLYGNADLRDYIGYWEGILSFDLNPLESLTNENIELIVYTRTRIREFRDISFKCNISFGIPFINRYVPPMLMIQFFSGYGQTLYDYREHQTLVRAGLLFYR